MPKTKSKLETATDNLREVANVPTPLTPTPLGSPPQVQSISAFDPAQYTATNLFSDSSTLPRTTKAEADKAVQSISEKRETLRLIGSNLQLNTDA